MRTYSLFIFFLLIFFFPAGGFSSKIPLGTSLLYALEKSTLKILNTDGQIISFEVEEAKNNTQRAIGLMFRSNMPANHGMLFLYRQPQTLSMWMKNTYIPLDMIFIHADGSINHIAFGAKPHDLTPIFSRGAAKAVLELNAGTVKKHNITLDSKIIHPAFFKSSPP